MKLQIVKLGRAAYPEIRTLVTMYEERLRTFTRIDNFELRDPDVKSGPHRSHLPGHMLVALDEEGQEWTSSETAGRLKAWLDDPAIKGVTFVIGGPMGLDADTRREAKVHWSLSKATLTSDMAWLLCWEQIYRAFNIIKGTPYHHAARNSL